MKEDRTQHYFQKIQKLLEEKIGLLATSLSLQNWDTCLQMRMAATGKENYGEYYAFLLSSLTELQELIELIVIPETWFFREERAFKFLAEYAKRFGEKYRHGTPLRILSLGCSTGEEPYSIVMCLLEAEMPLGSFRVEGADVSKGALMVAQRGLYGPNSFRTLKAKLKEKYFTEVDGKYELSDQVRFSVKFKKGNVVNFPSGFSQNQYDIIFCRNLLIYLSVALQEGLLRRLERVLAPRGVLILGEAEYGKINRLNFETMSLGGVSAYCKKGEDSQTLSDFKSQPLEPPAKHPAVARLRELADQGNIASAKREIKIYGHELQEDPEFQFLQGVIHHASGENDLALKYFQKAVSLEPKHKEALTYLSLMTEGALAERYRERINQLTRER